MQSKSAMKFNLAASVKHVTRVLNPDLEIPDSSGSKSSNAPSHGATRPSSSSSPSPPPSSASSSPPAATAAAAAAAAPSVPSSHNGTKYSSRRSSLSVRRLSRKSASIRTQQAPPLPPPSISTLEAKTTLSTAFQKDYSAKATQDPTLRSYPPPISSTRRTRASTTTATPGRSTYRSKLDPAATAEPITTTTTITAPYFGLTGLSSSTSPWTPGVPPTAPAQEGTATCLCGAVHLAFPTTSPGLVASFVCYCIDCRKGGAEAGVVVKDDFLKHLRGTSNLCSYSQPVSTPSSHGSTTFFCQACGSNMYRVGTAFPGCAIVRLGTVDDARLVEGRLRPTRELCVKERASWACGVKGEDVKRRVGLFS